MQTTGWAVSRDMIAEDEDMDEDEEQGIAQPGEQNSQIQFND